MRASTSGIGIGTGHRRQSSHAATPAYRQGWRPSLFLANGVNGVAPAAPLTLGTPHPEARNLCSRVTASVQAIRLGADGGLTEDPPDFAAPPLFLTGATRPAATPGASP